MRILLTGGTGYIGTFVLGELLKMGHNIALVSHSPESCQFKVPEVLPIQVIDGNVDQCFDTLTRFKPECVCHLAGLASPNRCQGNPEEAYRANVTYTKQVCTWSERLGSFLCYISTDWVFDGRGGINGLYKENDQPQPMTIYGQTKYQGEQICLASGLDTAVVRLSLVYGPRHPLRPNVISWMEDGFKSGIQQAFFEDEWRTPVYVEDVASGVRTLLERRMAGHFHFAGPQRLNRVEMGLAYAEFFGFSPELVAPAKRSDRQLSFRPEDLSLSAEKTSQVLGVSFHSLLAAFTKIKNTVRIAA